MNPTPQPERRSRFDVDIRDVMAGVGALAFVAGLGIVHVGLAVAAGGIALCGLAYWLAKKG